MTSTATLTTPDGRNLDYVTGGPDDGRPLLFHVGTPNAATLYDAVLRPATELGLRTICYSRPGYDGSTEQPGRTVADSISDVEALLAALDVDRFVTLGWSGGGPHALACAALLPERCQAAATLAGVAPYPAHGIDFLAGMDADNVAEFTAAIAGIQPLTEFLRGPAAQLAGVTGPGVAGAMSGLLSPVDRAALSDVFAADTADAMRRSVRQGVAGWRDDDLAFVADWGFTPAAITVPVAVWQGRQDRMVPFAHGQWLAAEIPGAEAHLFADEGHMSLIGQVRAILADLIRIAG